LAADAFLEKWPNGAAPGPRAAAFLVGERPRAMKPQAWRFSRDALIALFTARRRLSLLTVVAQTWL
jgi:hypothetical protein